jgi:hypothetical protein
LFTGVNDTTDKFFGGVSPANISLPTPKNEKLAKLQSVGVKCTKLSSEQNMKKNFISKFFSFFAGVFDTADKHSFTNISANFGKKSK